MRKRKLGPKSLEYEIDSEGLDEETEASSTESSSSSYSIPGCVVNANKVRVRSQPTKETENTIEVLQLGDEFDILDITGDFCNVRLKDGRVGYIVYEFCREV